jgi:hypothetical protein
MDSWEHNEPRVRVMANVAMAIEGKTIGEYGQW